MPARMGVRLCWSGGQCMRREVLICRQTGYNGEPLNGWYVNSNSADGSGFSCLCRTFEEASVHAGLLYEEISETEYEARYMPHLRTFPTHYAGGNGAAMGGSCGA